MSHSAFIRSGRCGSGKHLLPPAPPTFDFDAPFGKASREAIGRNPKDAAGYYYLACSGSDKGSKDTRYTLLDRQKVTRTELLLKAISLAPNAADPYWKLGSILKHSEGVTLLDGVTEMTKIELLLKAISLDPNQWYYYDDLALALLDGEEVTLPNGTRMTKRELFLKALSFNPTHSWLTYYDLGLCSDSFTTQRKRTRRGKEKEEKEETEEKKEKKEKKEEEKEKKQKEEKKEKEEGGRERKIRKKNGKEEKMIGKKETPTAKRRR